ncbi:MAG: type I pullulanase [Lachnospiraceae bacterium]|nr:type I pullulanase [Lachnospiraceae bacterium]
MKRQPLDLKKLYISHEFQKKYNYDGPLGSFCDEKGTSFLLWAPMADRVWLRLYEDGDHGKEVEEEEMELGKEGVWTYFSKENLCGYYYDFELELDGTRQISGDPYAKACGVNGHRSMVIDLAITNPKGWEEDCSPKKQPVDIIYELNIKDFMWDEASGVPEEYRGTYKSLCLEDTTLRGEGKIKTGLSHIVDLGVNNVQLMPVFDFASVDEAGDTSQFNWGYDPMNYNVPEGSFSTDPFHGQVRIQELKEVIMALHRNGIRVIMDVVYNHTYSIDSPLQRTTPWYFYRIDKEGNPSNGSACGNDIATEMPMCRKYIVDSVLYWAKEYHFDGFRFDLMGLLDVECINSVRKALDKEFGVGEKTIYGEPWKAGDTHLAKDTPLVSKENLQLLSDNVGIFSDDIRDNIKGSVFDFKDTGFANGKIGVEKKILEGLTSFGLDSSRIVSYVSCHDNQTLWDKLTETTEDIEIRKAQYKMAAALYMFHPGRVFFLSGEEFARSKGGEENSYNLPMSVNALRWNGREDNKDLYSYYKGLISLRKELSGLCEKDGRRNVHRGWHRRGALGFSVDNDSNCLWQRVNFIFNGRNKPLTLRLPKGEWEVLCDGESSRRYISHNMVQGKVSVEPNSVLIIGEKSIC